MLKRLADVLQPGQQGIRSKKPTRELPPVDFRKQIETVNQKPSDQKDAHIFVNGQTRFIATEQKGEPLPPAGLDERAGQARRPLTPLSGIGWEERPVDGRNGTTCN